MKCEIAISLQGKQTWQFPLPESGPTIKALTQIHLHVYGYTNGHLYVTFRTAVFKNLDGGNTSKFNVSSVFLSFLSNIYIYSIYFYPIYITLGTHRTVSVITHIFLQWKFTQRLLLLIHVGEHIYCIMYSGVSNMGDECWYHRWKFCLPSAHRP